MAVTTWLSVLPRYLDSPRAQRLRRRHGAGSIELVLHVATYLAGAADRKTGRNAALSAATIAHQIHYKQSSVRNVLQFLTSLGFLRTVHRGRDWLALWERDRARELGFPEQTRVASNRVLVVPGLSGDSVDISDLHPHGGDALKNHVPAHSPTGAQARKVDDAASRRRQLGRSLRERRPYTPVPSAEAVRIAEHLYAELPWLARAGHLGALTDAVRRSRLAERGWTAAQILRTVSLPPYDVSRFDDPLAWFMSRVFRSIPRDELSPSLTSGIERRVRQRLQREALRLEQVRRAQIAAEQDEIDRILETLPHRKRKRR